MPPPNLFVTKAAIGRSPRRMMGGTEAGNPPIAA